MTMREPGGQASVRVEPGSGAAGRRVVELPLTDRTWVMTVSRSGETFAAHGSTVLEAGDELTVIADVGDLDAVHRLFSQRA
jgi:Trk K+ transport system NAD-binding subunit